MGNININELTKTVNKILQDYGNEISDGAAEAAQAEAKETVKQLKTTSPKNENGSKRGYAKTWKFKFERNRLGSFVATVHNEKNYRLTHLLENGHLARNGKWVKGNEHIHPAELDAIAKFEKKIKELI